MKLKITLLILCILSSFTSFAQDLPTKGGNATASSQIRVRIPSFAVINLADNNSRAVSYKSASDLKNTVKQNNSVANVVANSKWSTNVTREQDYSYTASNTESSSNSSTSSPSFTVIYVTTQN